MTIVQKPIVRNATEEQAPYRGLAFTQMGILKAYMKQARLNVYRRVVRLANGVVITCKVCGEREDIYISVPIESVPTDVIVEESFDHVLLFNGEEIYGYNWESGDIEIRESFTGSGSLQEGYAQTLCIIDGDGALLVADEGDVSKDAAIFAATSKHLVRADVLVTADTTEYHIYSKDGDASLADALPDRSPVDMTQMNNRAIPILQDNDVLWNSTKSLEAWNITLPLVIEEEEQTPQVYFLHRWTPRVFHPDLGTAAPDPPATGLYYGRVMPWNDLGHVLNWDSSDQIVVYFGGYFDDRFKEIPGAVYPLNDHRVGYVETVISMTEDNETTPYLTAFFMAELWEPSRSYFYNFDDYKFVQNSLTIAKERFVIDYINHLEGPPDIHWWNSIATPYDDEAEPPIPLENRWPLQGILANDGNKWALHRHRGYVSLLGSGTDYVDHSVSTNGRFVTILTTTEILTYNIDAAVQIARTPLPDGEFTSCVIIPTRTAEEPAPTYLPASPVEVVDNSLHQYLPALGGFTALPYNNKAVQPYLAGWKTKINGRVAVCEKFVEGCWEHSGVTIIRPTSHEQWFLDNETFAVSIGGQEYRTTGWAYFADNLPYLLWYVSGIGAHNEAGIAWWDNVEASCVDNVVAIENVTVECHRRSEELLLGYGGELGGACNDNHILFPSNTKFPVEITGVWQNECGEYVPWFDQCTGLANVRVTDSCGIVGTLQPSDGGPDPLQLIGSVLVSVGSEFGHSGGRAPFDVEIEGMILDGGDTGYVTGLTDCTGLYRVTDVCGVTDEIETTNLFPTLTISGPTSGVWSDVPLNERTFTASGGHGPYSWSVSKGAITPNTDTASAYITGVSCASTAMAVATVTVTDSCGETASMSFRYKYGCWVITAYGDTGKGQWSYNDYNPGFCNQNYYGPYYPTGPACGAIDMGDGRYAVQYAPGYATHTSWIVWATTCNPCQNNIFPITPLFPVTPVTVPPHGCVGEEWNGICEGGGLHAIVGQIHYAWKCQC